MLSRLNVEAELASELAADSWDAAEVFSICSVGAVILPAATATGLVTRTMGGCNTWTCEPIVVSVGFTSDDALSTFFSELADAVALDDEVFVSVLDSAAVSFDRGSSFFSCHW